jgi:hypothetical protein
MSKKGIVVKVGGKEYVLRYDLNALCSLESALGIPLHELNPQKLGFAGSRALIWAALLHEEPKLTLSELGDRLDDVRTHQQEWDALMVNVIKSFGMAFPAPPKDDDPKNAESVASGTGTP